MACFLSCCCFLFFFTSLINFLCNTEERKWILTFGYRMCEQCRCNLLMFQLKCCFVVRLNLRPIFVCFLTFKLNQGIENRKFHYILLIFFYYTGMFCKDLSGWYNWVFLSYLVSMLDFYRCLDFQQIHEYNCWMLLALRASC